MIKPIFLGLMLLQAFGLGAWFYSLWIKDDSMTEILVDLDPDAVERLEAMAAEHGVTVNQLADDLLSDGLRRLEMDAPIAPVLT
jgi:hypothetical protein